MTSWYYVRPTDTIFVRGNLNFGEGGEHGIGMMPPSPSVFAGAFRSAILGRDAEELSNFVSHGRAKNADMHASLGTPTQPGDFRIQWLSLAGEIAATTGSEFGTIEALLPLPADLAWLGDDQSGGLAQILPRGLPAGLQSGGGLPLRATLQTPKQEKPAGGYYLRPAGLLQHLQGTLPGSSVKVSQIHRRDPRLGIGLNVDSRTAEHGLIYTTEGHAFSPPDEQKSGPDSKHFFSSTGFLVGVDGAAGLLPKAGNLRLGGDGRSAHYSQVSFTPPPTDLTSIGKSGRFRVILRTAALFPLGWLPAGIEETGGVGKPTYRLSAPGFNARLVCAALGRREVISGWDLHQWAPKPAEAAAPAGSVYWFDELNGDPAKLAAWIDAGMRDATLPTSSRHAEGFGQAWLGQWPDSTSS
jgi:CRISPR-associated protein Cmr3